MRSINSTRKESHSSHLIPLTLTSPNFPRHIENLLNPRLNVALTDGEDHAINISPPTATQGEGSQKCSATIRAVGVTSSFEDEEMVPEAALEVGLMKDPKSQEIAHLWDLVKTV
ncbi:hypothetical protein AMTR_s00043p00230940 [Amborella trichopoda]|uniref:Uncharacterized protein n=1 Tax=Amborella trichopoda TaxID=13333 RepID=W1PY11_AMBTC|nr:hypothetical protein AMTR_s00043p00230940 [Amborella trichopoda]